MADHLFGPDVLRMLKAALIAVWQGGTWETHKRNLWDSLKLAVSANRTSSCRIAVAGLREIVAEVGNRHITVNEAVEGISDVFIRARMRFR